MDSSREDLNFENNDRFKKDKFVGQQFQTRSKETSLQDPMATNQVNMSSKEVFSAEPTVQ